MTFPNDINLPVYDILIPITLSVGLTTFSQYPYVYVYTSIMAIETELYDISDS